MPGSNRRLVVGGVVICLLVTGCLSGIGGPSSSDPGPPDAAWTDEEELDSTALITTHFAQLRDAGSFQENKSDVILVEGEARPPEDLRPEGYYPPSRTRRLVDLDANRLLRHSHTRGERERTRFLSTDVKASRHRPCSAGECAVEYTYLQRADDAPVPYAIDRYRHDDIGQTLHATTANLTLTYDGAVQRDGERLYRYDAPRNLSHPAPPFSEPPTGTVTLLVTDDGIIRRFVLEYTGTATVSEAGATRTVNVTQRFVQTYTAVGETTVERPAWVDKARDSDPPPRTETGDS